MFFTFARVPVNTRTLIPVVSFIFLSSTITPLSTLAQCPTGQPDFVFAWGQDGCQSAPVQFRAPYGMCTDAQGNVYVSDSGANSGCGRILKFAFDGSLILSLPENGLENNGVSGLTTDGQGFLYLCNSAGNNLAKYDTTPSFQFASALPGLAASPRSITYAPELDLLVVGCDNGLNTVVTRALSPVLDPNGNIIYFSLPTQPRGVTVRGRTIYIGSQDGNIYRWRLDPEPSGRFASTQLCLLTPPVFPYLLQFDAVSHLYISPQRSDQAAGDFVHVYAIDPVALEDQTPFQPGCTFGPSYFTQQICWGGNGQGNFLYDRITSISVRPPYGLYLMDYENRKVKRYAIPTSGAPEVGVSAPSLSVALLGSALSVRLTVPEPQRLTVSLFDAGGRRRAVILDRWLKAGTHTVEYSLREALPSGLYLLKASGQQFEASGKLLVTK